MENRIAVLGPLSVVLQGVRVHISSAKHRVLLATLVAHRSATVDTIAEYLWGPSQPRNARAAIHVHVARLRRVLDDAAPGGGRVIISTSNGYRLNLADKEVDIDQLRALVRQAGVERDTGNFHAEKVIVTEALSLWRGDAFEDIESDQVRFGDAVTYQDLRTSLQERLFGIEINLGNHIDVLHLVQAAAARNPLRESITSQLMLALYRSGRQADALDTYHAFCRRLADELGVDPGSEIQALFEDLLRGDPGLLPQSSSPAAEAEGSMPWLTSCTLPRDREHFVGRTTQLETAAEYLSSAVSGPAVLAITGPPGSGKTAFAVHLAHQVRSQFPDGQLFASADVGGAAQTIRAIVRDHGAQAGVTHLLSELLLSTGFPRHALPDTTASLSSLLRARLSDRRVLIVLDGVDSTEELSLLLPGSGRSAVVLTGLSRLLGLEAGNDMHTIDLGPLQERESVALLEGVVNDGTGHPTRDELLDIAELCDHLPLALHLVGTQLRGRSLQFRREFLSRLRSDHILHQLSGDPRTAVGLDATLHTSYSALSENAQQLLRLMAFAPGGGFTTQTTAALLGSAELESSVVLDELIRSHLVTETEAGTAVLPELFRQFAAQRSAASDTPEHRQAALGRLARWYLTPIAQLQLRSPTEVQRHRTTLLALLGAASPFNHRLVTTLANLACEVFSAHGDLVDRRAAAAHGYRAARALDDHAGAERFAAAMLVDPSTPRGDHHLSVSGPVHGAGKADDTGGARPWADLEDEGGHLHTAFERALQIHEYDTRTDRDAYVPDNLTRIGRILVGLDRIADGQAFHHRALRAARRNHNLHARATAHLDLASACLLAHHFADAEGHALAARDLFGSFGDDRGRARASVALADVYRAVRRLDVAERLLDDAWKVGRRLGDDLVLVEASIGLALVYRYLDERTKGLLHGIDALLLARSSALSLLEGKALGVLAVNNHFAQRPQRARELLDEALFVHEKTGHELEKACVMRWLPRVDGALGYATRN
ncbi:AAA family ATPase [Rhodococcus rhodochrous]|uniref:AfsR/SARP family transcriptional regulator n=1 Tax=Rhodococcus rhodochrous TaxID=1829 RepID=UPI001E58EA39|nr:AfsR/SARP family transcriptional regulator [Rhodococcus rhodochrous]MCB8913384.1 AAA family ATPase [Rhodococcus rhodochrous]